MSRMVGILLLVAVLAAGCASATPTPAPTIPVLVATATMTPAAEIMPTDTPAPTLTWTPEPTSTETPIPPTPTVTPTVCPLDADFVEDVTIPDDTPLRVGATFTKTWLVKNIGTCAWPEDTVLAFVSGEQMGAPAVVSAPTTGPDQDGELSVEMMVPSTSGTYRGNWRLRHGEEDFGPIIWVRIVARAE